MADCEKHNNKDTEYNGRMVGWMVLGRFKHITFIVHFISIIITL